MSGGRVVVFWLCAAVLVSSVAFGGVVLVDTADAAVNQAEFQVTDATLDDDEILEGEEVGVTATVENTGEVEGTFTAELQIDGDSVDSENVTVAAGETETVSFSQTFPEAGEYDVAVSGESAGTLDVLEPPDFEVDDVELSDDEIIEGESVEVVAEIENEGEAEGTFTAELQVDGETVEEKDVAVPGDGTETVTFSRTFEEAGEYDVAVSGESGETLEVKTATADFEVDDVELSDDEIIEGESVEVVAEIENDGETEGTFTAELQVDGDTVKSEDVTVTADTTETVTFSRTFPEAGEYDVAVSGESAGTLTVEPEAEADLSVTRATLSESTITAGESVDVSAVVKNDGDAEGSLELNLLVNGSVEDDKNVSVDPGEEERVTFTFEPSGAGDYPIAVNDESAGTLVVKTPADLEVTGARVDSDVVLVSEFIEISAEVTNHGERDGNMDVRLEIDGNTTDVRTATVTGGESENVSFFESFEEAGEYDVAVNGVDAGNVTVETPANLTVTNATLENDTVVEGEPAGVTTTVENHGDREGDLLVELVVDGETEQTTNVTLDGNDQSTVTFTYTPSDADEDQHDIAVNDVRAGTLEVLEPADISIVNASLEAESIEEGESVQVTVDLENDGEVEGTVATELQVGNETLETANVTVGPNATETKTFDPTFDDAGEYNVSISGTSAGVLTVEEATNTGGGSGSSSSPGSSTSPSSTSSSSPSSTNASSPSSTNASSPSSTNASSSPSEPTESSDAGVETPADVEPTLNRTETTGTVTVRVENASGDSVVLPVDLTGPATAEPTISLSTLEIDPAGDRERFEVTTTQPRADPGELPTVPRGDALAYVDLETDLDANETIDATLRFELDRAAIPDGLGPGDVQVIRYANGEWTADGVTHDVDGDAHRVTLAEASPVAVVALEPGTVEVVDATLPADWVHTGHETEVRATVRNTGDLPKSRTLTLAVDGEPVAERNVLVESGETVTVELAFEPDDGGTVTLDGTEVGTLSVGGSPDTPDQGSTPNEIPGFGPIAAVLALLIAVLVARVGHS